MAEELRWETLQSVATADTTAFGEFRNETSGNISIRSIDMLFLVSNITTTTAVNHGQMQLTKSRVIDLVNNSTIFQLNVGSTTMNDETGGVGPNASANTVNKLYAKDQLTLEPGESVFGHLDFGGVPTNVQASITIGYHFD